MNAIAELLQHEAKLDQTSSVAEFLQHEMETREHAMNEVKGQLGWLGFAKRGAHAGKKRSEHAAEQAEKQLEDNL